MRHVLLDPTISVKLFLRVLISHLLTPNGFYVSSKIELGKWLHDKFDDHQTMLTSRSNALHETGGPQ